jgi:hypothetical protein
MTPRLPLDYIHDEMIRVCVPHGGVEPLVPILNLSREAIIKRAVQLRVIKAPYLVQRETLIRSLWGKEHYRIIAREAGISVPTLYKTAANLGLPRKRAA